MADIGYGIVPHPKGNNSGQNLANKEGFRSGIRRKISFNKNTIPRQLIESLKKKLSDRKQKYIDSTKNQTNKITTKVYKTFIESNQMHSVYFMDEMKNIIDDYMTLYPCRKKGTLFNAKLAFYDANN